MFVMPLLHCKPINANASGISFPAAFGVTPFDINDVVVIGCTFSISTLIFFETVWIQIGEKLKFTFWMHRTHAIEVQSNGCLSETHHPCIECHRMESIAIAYKKKVSLLFTTTYLYQMRIVTISCGEFIFTLSFVASCLTLQSFLFFRYMAKMIYFLKMSSKYVHYMFACET